MAIACHLWITGSSMQVALLHPGQMGGSIGDALVASGHDVGWCSEGRSVQSRARAEAFVEFLNFDELIDWADLTISICPPEAAQAQAEQVAQQGFHGIYVDANAVAPSTARAIAGHFEQYVDGGVIGPPARKLGTTRLYLSGERAGEVKALFSQGYLDARVIDAAVDSASSLKMAYAAYTKGSSALLLAVRALAEALGVGDALVEEWSISQPALVKKTPRTASAVAPKAWRFAGEMAEISQTFAEADLPAGLDQFHAGAEALYSALSEFKDQQDVELDTLLARLIRG